MLVEQAPWLGWTLVVVTVALAVAGFIYSPWIGFAALALNAFLVVTALSFVIMACGFNSITGVNMATHCLSTDSGVVRAEFEDGKTVEVDKKNIKPYKIYPGGVLVPVDGARPGWLWIPPGAFETPEDFQEFLKSLY